MITVSIMLTDNLWVAKARPGNLLLVRENLSNARADLEYVKSKTVVLGWVIFDEKGREIEGDNGGMCLNWTSAEFDSIDVFYGRRY